MLCFMCQLHATQAGKLCSPAVLSTRGIVGKVWTFVTANEDGRVRTRAQAGSEACSKDPKDSHSNVISCT